MEFIDDDFDDDFDDGDDDQDVFEYPSFEHDHSISVDVSESGIIREPGISDIPYHGMLFSEWIAPQEDVDLLSLLEKETIVEESLGQLIGNPADDMEYWHKQENPDTCAIVSQEYILENFLDRDFSEDELINTAIENGYYSPGAGTIPDDVGKLLEHHGINVERSEHNSIDDIIEKLENNQKIIIGVDAHEIWENSLEQQLNDIFSMPEANHAVEVIGYNDKSQTIILNDPGHPNGCGMEVPLSDFEAAWEDSNNFMVVATKPKASVSIA